MSQYNDYGFETSLPEYSHTYLLPSIKKLLNKEKNKCILDLGCGNGSMAINLIKDGFNVYGTDASTSGIEIAKKDYATRFYLQDLSHGSLPKELENIKFDTIISTEVIEHLYSPKRYFEFCREVLLKNGHGEIIISTPYHGHLKNIALAVTGKFDFHFTALWEGGHIKFWSKTTLTRALDQSGFVVTKFLGSGRVPFLWKSMIIKAEMKNI